jgi:hypothetical protein
MPNRFASGKKAIAECDRCGFRYKLKELKRLVIKTKNVNILVCPTCWEPDQPQLQLGMYPVDDPQALRNPRPDVSYWQAGLTGLKEETHGEVPNSNVLAFGTPSGGSRVIQWGWNPVGLSNPLGLSGLPNTLVANGQVGFVSVNISGVWDEATWDTNIWG